MISVDPTIAAARIAAGATIHAAWIQGWLTFAAGIFVLAGGAFAVGGAILAASRQVRLDEQRYAARVAAYRVRIEAVANELWSTVGVALHQAEIALRQYRDRGGGHYEIAVVPLPPAPDFAEDHWEDHALLGLAMVRALHKARVKLVDYTGFQQEVAESDLACDEFVDRVRTLRPGIENADGLMTFECENVVEENVTLLKDLKLAIHELKTALPVATG